MATVNVGMPKRVQTSIDIPDGLSIVDKYVQIAINILHSLELDKTLKILLLLLLLLLPLIIIIIIIATALKSK